MSRSQSPIVENGVQIQKRAFSTFEECGFELNEFGHIRSDFATLVTSQSLLVMNNAAQRLRELRAIEPDNSNKSFKDIVREIRPRWCQSPKQMLEFEQYLIDHKINELDSRVKQIEADKKAENDALAMQASETTE